MPEEILSFWFGDLDESGLAKKDISARWYKKDDAFDREIRDHFLADYEAIASGEREDWLDEPKSWLAYIIVLDQLARNMFRDSPKMYAEDHRALAATKKGIERGHDKKLAGHHRVFAYMPLMHSESLEDQDRCIELFRAFQEESSGPLEEALGYNLKYAVAHRDIVRDWGRFPHRNELLGRESTPEEEAFLKKPGSSF